MNQYYNKIINKTLDQIKKKNIQIYYNKFLLKLKDNKLKTSFNNEKEFVLYVSNLVKMYHYHANFYILHKSQNSYKNKPTEFTLGKDNIGIIKFFTYISNYSSSEKKRQKEDMLYEDNIVSFLDKNINMRGLILDFRDHYGGNMYPLLFSLSRFINNSTLFAWSNKKVKKNEKKWTNLIDGKIKNNQYYISESKNNINIPIAVIVGEKTSSSGEFIASCFIKRNNVKLFGNKTSGYLSINYTYFYDKYIFIIPELLQTSRNLKFQEFIEPDFITNHPITDAKKFIKNI
jgi:hypothetical protein